MSMDFRQSNHICGTIYANKCEWARNDKKCSEPSTFFFRIITNGDWHYQSFGSWCEKHAKIALLIDIGGPDVSHILSWKINSRLELQNMSFEEWEVARILQS